MLDSRTVSVLGLAPGNATVEAQIGACAPVQVPVTVNP
jgi:hypothetical protein